MDGRLIYYLQSQGFAPAERGCADFRIQQEVPHMFVRITFLLLFSLATAWAQNSGAATVQGAVRDASGAVVPGTQVTITHVDTGVKTTTTGKRRRHVRVSARADRTIQRPLRGQGHESLGPDRHAGNRTHGQTSSSPSRSATSTGAVESALRTSPWFPPLMPPTRHPRPAAHRRATPSMDAT